MSNDLVTTRQQPAALLLARRGDACNPTSRSTGRDEARQGRGADAFFGCASAPRLVNETKLAIVAVMLELDRPVTSSELRVLMDECRGLSILEYHLSTLVEMRVAMLVVDTDELRFRLDGSNRQGIEELLASMPLRAYSVKRI